MATKITAKKPLTGNKRSHALNATKMQQKPNLQVKTINGVKVRISSREARTINKKATKVNEEKAA
jgi:large subunit ribosomal protein L28